MSLFTKTLWKPIQSKRIWFFFSFFLFFTDSFFCRRTLSVSWKDSSFPNSGKFSLVGEEANSTRCFAIKSRKEEDLPKTRPTYRVWLWARWEKGSNLSTGAGPGPSRSSLIACYLGKGESRITTLTKKKSSSRNANQHSQTKSLTSSNDVPKSFVQLENTDERLKKNLSRFLT